MSFDLIMEALAASGVREDDEVAAYISGLDHLHRRFIEEMSPTHDPFSIAKGLFDWLWRKNSARYAHRGSYRLNEVIDSQLGKETRAAGNCLGLTLLYNCLLRKASSVAGAVHLENAFGRGPHVLSILKIKDSLIDIENILPQGFDYRGHLDDSSRSVWGDRELVADIYLSRGNEFYQTGNYDEALEGYETAISLNPRYERAVLNKAIVLDKMGIKG